MDGFLSTENLGFADSFNYSNNRLGKITSTKLEDMAHVNNQLGFE